MSIEQKKLELARAMRDCDDELVASLVASLVAELGELAVEVLDELDDRGIAPGNWGLEK